MRSTRLPVAALALSAIASGVVLAGPSQAAAKPCAAYQDPKGDTAAHPPSPLPDAGSLPLADDDTDLTSVAISTDGDSLVGYVSVAALGTRATYAPGDWHEFGFTMGGKVVEVFIERVPAPLDAVVTAAFGYGGVDVDGEYTADIATAKYDTASNTVAVSVKLADLEKAVGVPTKGAKLTKITARTRMHYVAVYSTMDTLAAPDAATYVIGTACTPPTGAAAAPAPSGAASSSASPAASASASASASPKPSASPAPKPSATAKPSPKPSPKPSAAPKKNPGCGTTAAPRPTPSTSASASASMDASASASASSSASASAVPMRAQAVPTTNGNATGVSLRVSATEVTACNTPTLSGQVTDVQGRAMPDVEVSLSAKAFDARGYTTFATVRTNSTGQFQLSVRPTVHISYAASAGNAKSPAVPVRVHSRVVIESPKPDTGVGSPVTLRGRIVPAFSKAAIELGYTQNGRYTVLGRTTTDAQGYWVVSGRAPRGRRTFSVTTPERDGNLAGKQSITLTVQ